jgi:hypothetical protein
VLQNLLTRKKYPFFVERRQRKKSNNDITKMITINGINFNHILSLNNNLLHYVIPTIISKIPIEKLTSKNRYTYVAIWQRTALMG